LLVLCIQLPFFSFPPPPLRIHHPPPVVDSPIDETLTFALFFSLLPLQAFERALPPRRWPFFVLKKSSPPGPSLSVEPRSPSSSLLSTVFPWADFFCGPPESAALLPHLIRLLRPSQTTLWFGPLLLLAPFSSSFRLLSFEI